jgi:hypothetical protein
MLMLKRLATLAAVLLALGGMGGCGETKAEEDPKARTTAQEEQHEKQQEKQQEKGSTPAHPSNESSDGAKPSESSKPSGGPSGERDEVKSSSHATDSEFCSEHRCIGSFETEGGMIVECTERHLQPRRRHLRGVFEPWRRGGEGMMRSAGLADRLIDVTARRPQSCVHGLASLALVIGDSHLVHARR